MTTPLRTRLHITPFTPELYNKIVPDTAKASATGVSYHSIETFPERGFGYIELSKEEADKLKKKLHGATLKGAKMRVEEARPVKKRKGEETEEERSGRKKAKREKAKREDGVLPGYELEEGRHVKRGWTDGKERKQVKRKDKKGEKAKVKEGKGRKESKEGKKVVFRTAVPPNAMPAEEKAEGKKKEKKSKREKVGKTPKVVQEFAKTKKSTGGLGDSDAVRPSLTYEEGKGWVDDDGSIVEPEPRSKRKRREREEARQAVEEAAEVRPTAEKVASKASAKPHTPTAVEVESIANDAASDSASASSSESVSDDISSSDSSSEEEASPTTSLERPTAPATVPKTTPPPTITTPREIHPLEALYKRAPPTISTSEDTKPSLQPLNTSFSFFNPDDVAASDTEQPTFPPQTPHTKQDLEWRALRSAAPTPDTAAIGRKFSFPFASTAEEEDDEDDDMEVDREVPALKLGAIDEKAEGGGESEFRKWFFEHRGDNNRAWKRKRREGKKVLRQRENRRVGGRVV
jgi:hypothetical protein